MKKPPTIIDRKGISMEQSMVSVYYIVVFLLSGLKNSSKREEKLHDTLELMSVNGGVREKRGEIET